jgi:hypothetical protein
LARAQAMAAIAMTALASTANPSFGRTYVAVAPDDAAPPRDPRGFTVPTMAEAVAYVEKERARDPQSDFTIELLAGTHRLAAPVMLAPTTGGNVGKLTIRGSPQGGVRVLGSVRLAPAPLDPAVLALFPAAVRGNVRAFELPEKLRTLPVNVPRKVDYEPRTMPFELYDDFGALRPARWPNTGFATGRAEREGGTAFEAERSRIAFWQQAGEIWLASFLRVDWGYATTPIDRLEPDTGRIVLAEPPQYGFRDNPRYAVEHVAAELDEPGEWYRDPKSRHVYVWPRDGGGAIEASVTERLLIGERASDIVLRDIVFERAAGDAVVLRGARNVTVTRCSFRWLGGRAVVLDESLASTVSASRIESTGEGGIWIAGGDRARLAAGNSIAEGNVIERFSRLGLASRPAVQLEGVGNRAIGNFIAGSAAVAIGFRGNDHLIELNEFTDVVTDSSDAGAIYTGRDFTAQGTIIRRNFLHGIAGKPGFEVKGVYIDDQASGITVEENVFLGVEQPVFLGGGRDNSVLRNVFLRSSPAIHLDDRGMIWARKDLADPDSEINGALRAVPYQSVTWLERYPRLYDILDDHRERPKRNRAEGNLFLASTPFRLLPEVDPSEQRFKAPVPLLDIHEGPDVEARVIRVRTPVEIAAAFRDELARAGLADLPFASMDRRTALRGAGAAGAAGSAKRRN